VALLGAVLGSLALQAQTVIQGAGATFPYPLYSKWISEYRKVNPQVNINYQSIGSGGGIKQITERTVDFGATDAPMSGSELAKIKSPIYHIPMTLGAVAVAYNVPGAPAGLKLSPEVLSGIFLGTITKWNDGKLVSLNPGVNLPSTPIMVAYRTDGSGTTAVFTDYLAKISVDWKAKVGAGKSVKFPVGLGAKGNEGVTGLVKGTPGAIGYLELAYAKQNNLPVAAIRNKVGKFVAPSPEGVTSAASGNDVPGDLCLSITDGPGAKDYPISSFSYILVYQDQQDGTKGKALADFLWWATHEGQKFAAALDYAPLPTKDVLPKIEAKLRTLKAGGQQLIKK
jgi:phosphate transport system substrate-binding protein